MALTPMMQQYLDVKEKHRDCILFFRLGDFYEMFFEDAEIASKELELVLTGRDCGLEERAPMCGIPYHAADNYIGRLVNKGYKIAICEQLEDPALAKGIVKRGIIKIITPGTYTNPLFLEENKNNYISCLYIDYKTRRFSICFSDVSTGEFNCTDSYLNISTILDEISKYNPRELLIQESIQNKMYEDIGTVFNGSYTLLDKEYFDCNSCDILEKQFDNFNPENSTEILTKCCGALLKYIVETQKNSLSHINKIKHYNIIDYMSIDSNSRRNLELTESLIEKKKRASLLWVLDRTNTAMGGRQLRRWIEQPLIDKIKIQMRLNAVEEIMNSISCHEDLKTALRSIYDIERLVGKISSQSVNAKELIFLKNSIEKLPVIKSIISNFNGSLLKDMYSNLDELRDIYDLIDKSIIEEPPVSIKEGNLIKKGYNPEIDELKDIKSNGKEWIASLENSERKETGIKSLKIGYNKVFGYYIEVRKSNLNLVPEGRYVRKQTLANAERYITPKLKEMEDKILKAEDQLINLEYSLFVKIRNTIEKQVDRMQKTAKIISELDCLSSLAAVALENNYCKPEITSKDEISIIEGRHPVVEKMLEKGSFVSNDTNMDIDQNQLLLITGPNMAGKSTYMRQIALIVIMAQIGSFVPAKSAVISICDKIFTRIGASDDLASGKSTFMVEMWEVSNILKNATNKSLVLLDEVGRGTSTYDGLSIAMAVIEYMCKNKKLRCKTLFATHYHELTELEGDIRGVKNYSVAVKEMDEEVIFLRKIVPGGADQSYGIEVAKLAGLPDAVVNRAREILKNLEAKKDTVNIRDAVELKKSSPDAVKEEPAVQMDMLDIERQNILKEISDIDILNMTPMDGFNKLYDIIKIVKSMSK
ncbi:MAG: DNA mismatch repair protein MutS [Clostridium sp.]|jgi:DNA mismatch repair protein MutS|uniref:DNA mismatch repair protein MutS n=1 Tax=Clostridium sp. TaxID=1506 RepID=UPI0025BDB543|nr:DNA mismatch repair protein MutS [Clostridium sp.]MCH3963834.1 DNA mismatch repair protein MutS [Clostridium sp.]MCI1716953.1 DNA mismatch repair protein MutS [Clostridium sp.]MCI1801328.1 DNA mismatch repair protein MutS [Clostridium sp.]MCI1815174.1 DNA mismatch repair protein MutS [Clostridium sp.]MCI1872042.1 DNA mismatch repair protein MutS [Clostridium sp.]